MWRRALLLSLPVAIFEAATGWQDWEPDAIQAVIAVGWVGGMLALGALAGWRALPCFAAVYVAAAALLEATVHETPQGECDPFCSSPATGVVFVLPFLLVLLLIGIGGGAAARAYSSSSSM